MTEHRAAEPLNVFMDIIHVKGQKERGTGTGIVYHIVTNMA